QDLLHRGEAVMPGDRDTPVRDDAAMREARHTVRPQESGDVRHQVLRDNSLAGLQHRRIYVSAAVAGNPAARLDASPAASRHDVTAALYGTASRLPDSVVLDSDRAVDVGYVLQTLGQQFCLAGQQSEGGFADTRTSAQLLDNGCDIL